jgi:hypothetical protein
MLGIKKQFNKLILRFPPEWVADPSFFLRKSKEKFSRQIFSVTERTKKIVFRAEIFPF